MSKIRHIIISGIVAVAAGLLATTTANAADNTGAISKRIGPTVKTYKGEKCVEPTEDMRRNHMKYILHQRDKTMYQGIRTTKHSLKNCVNCHTDPKTNSVLGKDGFCESCHVFASVSIDCFSCHSSAPEKEIPPRRASGTVPGLMDAMHASAVLDNIGKDHP